MVFPENIAVGILEVSATAENAVGGGPGAGRKSFGALGGGAFLKFEDSVGDFREAFALAREFLGDDVVWLRDGRSAIN